MQEYIDEAISGGRHHVLLIGDWEDHLEAVEDYLRAKGFDPFSEHDGDVLVNF